METEITLPYRSSFFWGEASRCCMIATRCLETTGRSHIKWLENSSDHCKSDHYALSELRAHINHWLVAVFHTNEDLKCTAGQKPANCHYCFCKSQPLVSLIQCSRNFLIYFNIHFYFILPPAPWPLKEPFYCTCHLLCSFYIYFFHCSYNGLCLSVS